MALNGVISNLRSLGDKFLSLVTTSAQAPSSFSSPPGESCQIKSDLGSLMERLARIKATLHDAEERKIIDESVKLWLRELKGVAYNAEDALGEYHYEVLRAQVEARNASALNPRKRKQVQIPDGLVDQIQQIKDRFEEICKDHVALKLFEEDGPRRNNSEVLTAPTSHFIGESDIIGGEKEKDDLIDLLFTECRDGNVVSVVTIVGTGGLGKTALAQLVYNDQKVKQKFDKLGWVCVSEDFNVQRLTRESVESITGNSFALTNLSALQNKIYEEVRGKRVFLVLDDVWNEKRSFWEIFQTPFRSAAMAKILVTTRNEPVARIMQTVPTFKLGYLSEDQCWQLFQRYAFGGINQNEGSELVKIGKQIIKKCGMLPLAIKSIAALLRHEVDDEESWREILECELWEISDAKHEIFAPLQISYARLPTHLKPCFLYCSMFPKDYLCRVEEVVQLWISQGYIESNGKKNKEKIGKEYAEQLWERSFFESVGGYGQGVFKLHDMVHDLARLNSENACYSIESGKVPDFPEEDLYNLFVGDHVRLVEPLLYGKFVALRTLILGYRVENLFSTFDFSNAQKLRALVLKSPDHGSNILSSVVNLKHLCYLSLRSLSHIRLPECICSLYSLQSLTIESCLDLIELPKSIENLVSLEKLVIGRCKKLSELPESIGNLVNLEKLVIGGCEKLNELPESIGNLVNLEKLVIENCLELRELPESIGNLVNLEKLVIGGGDELRELPESIGNLVNLEKLVIGGGDELRELPQSIGNLVNLEKLVIEGGDELRVLPVSLFQLKALTKLRIFGCDNLGNIPDDIGNLTKLQQLCIDSSTSTSSLLSSLGKCTGIETLNLELRCKTIGWLKDFVDLEGTLYLEGLNRMPSLTDVQCANLISMHNLERLKLCWGPNHCWSPDRTEKQLRLVIDCFELEDISGNTFPVERDVMDRLQPHQNLRELHIVDYNGFIFSNWIGNSTSCASLEKIVLKDCANLAFLPLGSLCKLKYLVLYRCSNLQFLRAEYLPLELQELEISGCRGLISVPGIKKLKSLVKLHIGGCENLHSLLMEDGPSVEQMMYILPSLRSLWFTRCPKLQLLVDEWLPVESCRVRVSSCPGLKDWCLQHNIPYGLKTSGRPIKFESC